LPSGFDELESILDFDWPADAGGGSSMVFWAALMSPDLAEILAIDSCAFGFSEGQEPIGQSLPPQWLGSDWQQSGFAQHHSLGPFSAWFEPSEGDPAFGPQR